VSAASGLLESIQPLGQQIAGHGGTGGAVLGGVALDCVDHPSWELEGVTPHRLASAPQVAKHKGRGGRPAEWCKS